MNVVAEIDAEPDTTIELVVAVREMFAPVESRKTRMPSVDVPMVRAAPEPPMTMAPKSETKTVEFLPSFPVVFAKTTKAFSVEDDGPKKSPPPEVALMVVSEIAKPAPTVSQVTALADSSQKRIRSAPGSLRFDPVPP